MNLMTRTGAIAATMLLIASASAQADMTIRLGSISPVDGADYQAAEVFKTEVEALSGGGIKVTIFPSSQLGTYKEMLEQIRAGALEGLYESMGDIGPWHALAGLEAVPYLYKDEEHFFRVWRSEVGEGVLDTIAQEAGFRVVGPAFRGFRQMSVNREIRTVEDVAGMKIRAPAIPAYVDAWKAFGANPTPISFEEVYTAIQQGVVEGQENPIGVIYDHRFDEVTKYLVLSNHMAETMGFIFNEAWWKDLEPEERDAIERAALASSDWYRTYTRDNEGRMVEELRAKGMTVIEPDQSGFIEKAKTAPVDPKIADWVEKIRAVE